MYASVSSQYMVEFDLDREERERPEFLLGKSRIRDHSICSKILETGENLNTECSDVKMQSQDRLDIRKLEVSV